MSRRTGKSRPRRGSRPPVPARERAWVVVSLGTFLFLSPVWDWVLRLGPWWLFYAALGGLVAAVAWVHGADG